MVSLACIFPSSRHLQGSSNVEVLERSSHTHGHGLLTLTNPHTGVEELLVGLVLTIGVADMRHQVVLLADHVVADTAHVGKLHVGVQIDLDDTQLDGLEVLVLAGAGTTVEDKVDGLVLLLGQLLLNVGLVLAQQLRVQLDVARLVHTCDLLVTAIGFPSMFLRNVP